MKPFPPDIKAKIHSLYVDKGLSALAISKKFNGHPAAQTISLYAKHNGWNQERSELEQNEYEKLSPQNLVNKILQHIAHILDKKTSRFTTKDADALAKLRVSMEKITDKKYQVPMMFELLTQFINFLNTHYEKSGYACTCPACKNIFSAPFVTEEFINATRHFKNNLKSKLEGSAIQQAVGD